MTAGYGQALLHLMGCRNSRLTAVLGHVVQVARILIASTCRITRASGC